MSRRMKSIYMHTVVQLSCDVFPRKCHCILKYTQCTCSKLLLQGIKKWRTERELCVTLCSMIATNTITSTSVLEVDTAAPRATPSAEIKIKRYILLCTYMYYKLYIVCTAILAQHSLKDPPHLTTLSKSDMHKNVTMYNMCCKRLLSCSPF